MAVDFGAQLNSGAWTAAPSAGFGNHIRVVICSASDRATAATTYCGAAMAGVVG